MTDQEHRYDLGEIDYDNSGRRNCKAAITWTLSDDGRFAMRAEIWNPHGTDIYLGGQCVDTVAAYFPNDAKAQRMVSIWRRWHLNDMRAGSPAQEAWLKANPVEAVYPDNHYDKACAALTAAGLNPDPSYEHNGQPYHYGSDWLCADLPADIRAEIESWG